MWNIQLCVAAAVRQNQLVGKATLSEVENIIKLWLRYATDRSGGRHTRNRRRAASTQHELPDSDALQWRDGGVQSAAASVVPIVIKLRGVAVTVTVVFTWLACLCASNFLLQMLFGRPSMGTSGLLLKSLISFLQPDLSEDGSNKRAVETVRVAWWKHFLMDAAGKQTVKLQFIQKYHTQVTERCSTRWNLYLLTCVHRWRLAHNTEQSCSGSCHYGNQTQ